MERLKINGCRKNMKYCVGNSCPLFMCDEYYEAKQREERLKREKDRGWT